jgi:predicted GNAT family acetyltransferase
MIRLLTQQDYDIVQSYLDKDPLNNVYLIHGLQTYGLESKQVTFWGAFNNDRLEGVLLASDDGRHRTGYLAGDNPEVLAGLGKFALEANVNRLFGKSEYIQPAATAVENPYPQVEIQRTYGHLYEVHPGQAVGHYGHPVRTATRDDISLLLELYGKDEISKRGPGELEREIQRAIDRSACFFIESGGRAVSTVRVDPETDKAGVIELARTLPEFRGRGMYPCLRTACVEYLSRKGKVALGVIADTNTAMHRVVDKCGGSLTDPWLHVRFKKRPPLRRRILPSRLRRWALRIKDRVLRH